MRPNEKNFNFLNSLTYLPWPQFPHVYSLDYAQEEAKALFGEDPREFSIMTTKFVGDENGNLKELHTIQIQRIVDETGRKIYQPIPGTERVFPAQIALIAIGFDGPEQTIVEQIGLETDRRSNVKARYGKYVTNVERFLLQVICVAAEKLHERLINTSWALPFWCKYKFYVTNQSKLHLRIGLYCISSCIKS